MSVQSDRGCRMYIIDLFLETIIHSSEEFLIVSGMPGDKTH